jgi:hypothetical protein
MQEIGGLKGRGDEATPTFQTAHDLQTAREQKTAC